MLSGWRGSDSDLEGLRHALAERFPTLHVVAAGRHHVVRGSVLVIVEEVELDRYSVVIDPEPVKWNQLPTVREIGGRIPQIADRHVYDDGSACVCLPLDYFAKNPGPIDIVAFIAGPVHDYFRGQTLVHAGLGWPSGEWGHGDAGVTEWWRSFSTTLSDQQFRAYLEALAAKRYHGHRPCPCGGGRPVRRCHLNLVASLRAEVPREAARRALARTKP